MENDELKALLKESHEGSKRGVEFAGYAFLFIGVAILVLGVCAIRFNWF